MKTRRQRKGGTRRGGGIMGLASATMSNLKTGGGRVIQLNQLINDMPPDAWRMCKGMFLLMSGEDPTDKKYEKLNPLPTVAYLNQVREKRGVPKPLTEAAEKKEKESGEVPTQETTSEAAEPENTVPQGDGVEPENTAPKGDGAEPENNPNAPVSGGTRKNYRNRI